ncbi:MAG: hypothetical protein V2A73_03400 [Pseudomonadota bacterium]
MIRVGLYLLSIGTTLAVLRCLAGGSSPSPPNPQSSYPAYLLGSDDVLVFAVEEDDRDLLLVTHLAIPGSLPQRRHFRYTVEVTAFDGSGAQRWQGRAVVESPIGNAKADGRALTERRAMAIPREAAAAGGRISVRLQPEPNRDGTAARGVARLSRRGSHPVSWRQGTPWADPRTRTAGDRARALGWPYLDGFVLESTYLAPMEQARLAEGRGSIRPVDIVDPAKVDFRSASDQAMLGLQPVEAVSSCSGAAWTARGPGAVILGLATPDSSSATILLDTVDNHGHADRQRIVVEPTGRPCRARLEIPANGVLTVLIKGLDERLVLARAFVADGARQLGIDLPPPASGEIAPDRRRLVYWQLRSDGPPVRATLAGDGVSRIAVRARVSTVCDRQLDPPTVSVSWRLLDARGATAAEGVEQLPLVPSLFERFGREQLPTDSGERAESTSSAAPVAAFGQVDEHACPDQAREARENRHLLLCNLPALERTRARASLSSQGGSVGGSIFTASPGGGIHSTEPAYLFAKGRPGTILEIRTAATSLSRSQPSQPSQSSQPLQALQASLPSCSPLSLQKSLQVFVSLEAEDDPPAAKLASSYELAIENARLKYAPYVRQRWTPFLPDNHAELAIAGRRASLEAQVRLEPIGYGSSAGGPYRPVEPVRPRTSQLLIERATDQNGRWHPFHRSVFAIGSEVEVDVSAEGRLTLDYLVGPEALGGTLRVTFDGKQVATRRLLFPRGRIRLGRLAPGRHRARVDGAPGLVLTPAPPAEHARPATHAAPATPDAPDMHASDEPGMTAIPTVFVERKVWRLVKGDAGSLAVPVRLTEEQETKSLTIVVYTDQDPGGAGVLELHAVIDGGKRPFMVARASGATPLTKTWRRLPIRAVTRWLDRRGGARGVAIFRLNLGPDLGLGIHRAHITLKQGPRVTHSRFFVSGAPSYRVVPRFGVEWEDD